MRTPGSRPTSPARTVSGPGGNDVRAATVGNDHYADVNGNVYKNTGSGWEQHNSNGGWSSASGEGARSMESEERARDMGEQRSAASSWGGGERSYGGGFRGRGSEPKIAWRIRPRRRQHGGRRLSRWWRPRPALIVGGQAGAFGRRRAGRRRQAPVALAMALGCAGPMGHRGLSARAPAVVVLLRAREAPAGRRTRHAHVRRASRRSGQHRLGGQRARCREGDARRRLVPADPVTFESSVRIAVDTALRRPDDSAPVSALFLFGRVQDLAFEQPVPGGPKHRHHVRFWRWSKERDGLPVWFGAVTYDERAGLSYTTGQVTHHIGEDAGRRARSSCAEDRRHELGGRRRVDHGISYRARGSQRGRRSLAHRRSACGRAVAPPAAASSR